MQSIEPQGTESQGGGGGGLSGGAIAGIVVGSLGGESSRPEPASERHYPDAHAPSHTRCTALVRCAAVAILAIYCCCENSGSGGGCPALIRDPAIRNTRLGSSRQPIGSGRMAITHVHGSRKAPRTPAGPPAVSKSSPSPGGHVPGEAGGREHSHTRQELTAHV